MKTVIIVQARMQSQRLPGKVLMCVLDNSLLGHLIERLKHVQHADQVVVATTDETVDLPIVTYCEENEVHYFRGSQNDVLARYYFAARACAADVIVRITADCPLMDPQVVDDLICHYKEAEPQIDYLANVQERTFPRGMDVEVFNSRFLEEAFFEAKEPYEREHVTPYMYHHPEKYRSGVYKSGRKGLADMRLTVDMPEDFTLVSRVIEGLYPENPSFSMDDVLGFMKQQPELQKINAHVKQKTL